MRATIIALMLVGVTACATTTRDAALFDGTDLAGWSGEISRTAENADGHQRLEDFWSARDGELHCTGGPGHWSWLHTNADYTNYQLHVEWRWTDIDPARPTTGPTRYGFNSAIFLRANERTPRPIPGVAMPAMYEAQIMRGAGQATGDLLISGYNHPDFHGPREMPASPSRAPPSYAGYGTPTAESRARMQAEGTSTRGYSRSASTERAVGEWNAYDILVNGGRMELRVNGQLVNDADGAGVIPGKIGLECQNTPISFRNIRVTRLD